MPFSREYGNGLAEVLMRICDEKVDDITLVSLGTEFRQ